MTPDKIESILVDYTKKNLSPTEDEQDVISKRYEELSEFLERRTIQNGSYARHTSTTPVNDLDVIYELPAEVLKNVLLAEAKIDTSKLDIFYIIESLAEQLKDLYGSSATIKHQPHSVGVYFGSENDFSIDVVPAFPASNGMFWVPESSHLSVANRRIAYAQKAFPELPNWIKSDPRGYIAQAKTIDDATDGCFRKAAKLIRKWRWRYKQNDKSFRLKSFHIEVMITELFKKNQSLGCFDAIRQAIDLIPHAISAPRIPDRADSSRMIDQYVSELTLGERNTILAAQRSARMEINYLIACSTETETVSSLQRFLGINKQFSSALSTNSSNKSVYESRKIVLKGLQPTNGREVGEQFLSDFGIRSDLRYPLKINARVKQDGFRTFKLLGSRFPLYKSKSLEFYIDSHDIPGTFEVKWKVKNTGAEARQVKELRGEIYNDLGKRTRTETTKYLGHHYVECYAIQRGVCVAADHMEVPIGRREEETDT